MKRAENYLNKAFIISSIYLLTITLGVLFILPSTFQVNSIPLIVELFLKIISVVAVIVVLSSAVIIPYSKLIQKPKQRVGSPVVIAATILLVGLVFIFLHGLYVKLMTCPADGVVAWYCRVEGKSYIGMLVLAFLLASLIGFASWIGQWISRKLTKV